MFHTLTGKVNRCSHDRYVVGGSILQTSECVIVCGATADILTATAATTIVDPVPSCIPQWSGWRPRDLDMGETFLDCSEVTWS